MARNTGRPTQPRFANGSPKAGWTKKTPVKHTDKKGDWIFLGDMPEFADLFAPKLPSLPKPPVHKGLVGIFSLVLIAAAAYYFITKYKNH